MQEFNLQMECTVIFPTLLKEVSGLNVLLPFKKDLVCGHIYFNIVILYIKMKV
jgi:hypothetical protein